jgi:hypothetical protein
MDSRLKHYREKAEEVRRLAARAPRPEIRAEFLNIAAQYERMAAQLEHQQTHRELRVRADGPAWAETGPKPDREDAR